MANKNKTTKRILLAPIKALLRLMFKAGHELKHLSFKKVLRFVAAIGEGVIKFIYNTGLFVENTVIRLIKLVIFAIALFIKFTYATGEKVIKYTKIVTRFLIKIIMIIPKSFVRDFSYWAPALSAVSVIAVLFCTNYYALALKVSVGGKSLGYVQSEDDFASVVTKVEDNLGDSIGENYVMKTTPEYSFAIVNKEKLSSDEIYSGVFEAVCEEIGEHYGLFVDGTLVAATENKKEITTVLDELKAPHQTGAENESVEFVANVEIKKGIFAPSYFIGQDGLRKKFSSSTNPKYYVIQEDDYLSDIVKATGLSKSQIYALNPGLDERRLVPGRKLNISSPDVYLGIKIVKTITYEESIAYQTIQIKDNSLYKTQTKVKKAGKTGAKDVTAEITYVDGVQVSKKIISETVTREPVTRELYVGTKALPTSSSPLAGTGTFIRPISGGYTSCAYGGYRGHVGVDLTSSGAYGKPVYATASGTVIAAGWSGGYGKCVKISHSNGYTSWYAHMSSIDVSVGQTVYQGQQVGRIGSTGNSTGPHLHFELRVNGTPVNPMRYIG